LTGQTSALRENGKKDLQHQGGLLDESGDYRVLRVYDVMHQKITN
jgi:hypothetical protein